jgi:hypothetical protein
MPPSLSLADPFTAPDFTVGPGGQIKKAPGRFIVRTKEVVVWEVTNNSKEPIAVTIMGFLLKKHPFERRGKGPAKDIDYFDWPLTQTLHLDATNKVGFLYARVKRKPPTILGEHLSYMIRVQGSFGTKDYDPDGDIKP